MYRVFNLIYFQFANREYFFARLRISLHEDE